MKLWLATGNAGKVREFKELLAVLRPGWELFSLQDLPNYFAPPETGKSFRENALIKAKSLKALKPEQWVLAEDSGLEVAGLGGLPGVHSARYAGQNAKDAENNAKLLKMLQIKQVSDRSARYFCHLVAFSPDGDVHHFEGVWNGAIATKPSGQQGFGYDPLFIPAEPEAAGKTVAELGYSFKFKHSHRSKALRAFLASLPS
jgi:XTP/dITP diphosphohydrolase